MNIPRIMVVASGDFSGGAIERFGGGAGHWSHMASILADGLILDARDNAMTIGGREYPAGVRLRAAGYLDAEPRWAIFQAPTGDHYDAWLKAGLSQLGKPYDKAGIVDFAESVFTGKYEDGNYVPNDPAENKAWFCDELAAWMAMQAGDVPWPPSAFPLYWQTPESALDLFIGAGWKMTASKGIAEAA